MAVVLQANAGFVAVAPSADPLSTSIGVDGSARAHKHTTPASIGKITEIGWFKGNISNVGDYQLCLYSHHVGNDVPDALLYTTAATTSGMPAGWLTKTVDWAVSPETIYWLALQVDNVTGSIDIDYAAVGGRESIDTSLISPPDPWVSAATSTKILAIYAVVESVSSSIALPLGTNF